MTRAWFMLVVVSVIYLLNSGFPYFGGSVLNSLMAEQQGIARSTLGLGFTIMLLVQGIAGPAINSSMVRFGMRATFVGGCGLLLLGSLLMAHAVSQAWSYLLVFGVLIGLGTGLSTYIPAQTLIAQWFDRHRSLAFSIVIASGGLGGFVVAPMLGSLMASNGNDWRAGWEIAAYSAAAMALLSWAVLRERLVTGPVPAPDRSGTGATGDAQWTTARLFRSRLLWIIVLGDLAVGMPIMCMLAHGIAHLDAQHITPVAAASAMGVMSLSSIAGKMIAGVLGDRFDPRYLWSAALIVVLIGMLLAINATGVIGVQLFAITLGVGSGAGLVCKLNLTSRYFGRASFGMVMGAMAPISICLTALSPYIVGLSWDWTHSYLPSFWALSVLALIAACVLPFAQPPQPSAG